MLLALLYLLLATCSQTQLQGQQSQIGRPASFTTVPAAASEPRSASPLTSSSVWIDTANRAVVANSYLSTFLPSGNVTPGWTGSVTNGDAGSTTQAYRDAVLLRINWFRQMAGVPVPITFTTDYNRGDQQAALMMSANMQLNHTPPTDWMFYSAAGAEAAAHSNLCLNLPYLNDPGCVAQYMQDAGPTNFEVGHRRWLIYPQTQNMGTGDVKPPFPLAFANAMWVVDTHYYDPRPPTRNNFVAWPPPGYVPAGVVPGRWSFSYPGADFSNSVVTMQRGGGSVAVRMETPLSGFGDNTVVWVPDNIDANVTTRWPVPAEDTPINVTISRVRINGIDTMFNYTVIVIDPSTGIAISGRVTSTGLPLPGVMVSLSGGPSVTTDVNGMYNFILGSPVPYLIVPTLSAYGFTPSSRTATPPFSSADFNAAFCDYSGVGGLFTVSGGAGIGTYSYSLAGGCPWVASSTAPWLTISPSTKSGTGPVNVTYSFNVNNGAPRSTTLTISSQ